MATTIARVVKELTVEQKIMLANALSEFQSDYPNDDIRVEKHGSAVTIAFTSGVRKGDKYYIEEDGDLHS